MRSPFFYSLFQFGFAIYHKKKMVILPYTGSDIYTLFIPCYTTITAEEGYAVYWGSLGCEWAGDVPVLWACANNFDVTLTLMHRATGVEYTPTIITADATRTGCRITIQATDYPTGQYLATLTKEDSAIATVLLYMDASPYTPAVSRVSAPFIEAPTPTINTTIYNSDDTSRQYEE